MKNNFFLIIVILVFSSCQNKNISSAIYTLTTIQENNFEKKARCIEIDNIFKMLDYESSNIQDVKGINTLSLYRDSIDIETQKILKLLLDKKYEILKKIDIRTTKDNESIDSKELKVKNISKNLLTKNTAKKLNESLINFRTKICNILITSSNFPNSNNRYFFKDPLINNFNTYKELKQKVDLKFNPLKISPDEIEEIKKIYILLSFQKNYFNDVFNSSITSVDNLITLMNIENKIYSIKINALDLLLSRMCYTGASFTNIKTVINGPNSAKVGDTVILQLYTAAINENFETSFEVPKNSKIIKKENGITFLQYVIPSNSKKDCILKGKSSYLLSNGKEKNKNWEHKIFINK